MSRAGRPDVARLVRVLDALERDAVTPLEERALRDRALRAALPAAATDPERLDAWLERFDPDGGALERRARSALARLTGLLVALGAAAGWAGALGAFWYDGTARVNVLAVLGALLALPVGLLALSWAAALGGASGSPLPGAPLAALRRLSSGRVARWLVRFLADADRRALALLLGPDEHDGGTLAGVRRWLTLRWSHLAACGFFAGALATTLALVVFTDLAFGWSTTLDLAPASLHRAVAALAAPWAWALPGASPGADVIEATRYFRAAPGAAPAGDPALFGRWWSFVVMALAVYGLAPRALSAAAAGIGLRRALARAETGHPDARSLLERLAPGPVETRGESGPVDPGLPAHAGDPAWPPVSARGPAVNWNGLPIEDPVLARALGASAVHHAGGTRTTAEDLATASALAGERAVLVACKAWEPPLLDLLDFLGALVPGAGAGGPRVVVVPLGAEAGAPAPPAARDAHVWQRALAASGVELASLPVRNAG